MIQQEKRAMFTLRFKTAILGNSNEKKLKISKGGEIIWSIVFDDLR